MSINEIMNMIYMTNIVFYIISIIGYYNIFKKANVPPFLAFIPIYNNYLLYRISWKQSNAFLLWLSCYFGGNIMTNNSNIIFVILGTICLMASIYISYKQCRKLSASFGHGLLFSIGLLFITPIFMFILAFDKSIYLGPQD